MDTQEAPAGLSRRRILQGAAWAAPAVLVATAAPAAAVSGDPDVTGAVVTVTSYSGGAGWAGPQSIGIQFSYAYQPWLAPGWPTGAVVPTAWLLTCIADPSNTVVSTQSGTVGLIANSVTATVNTSFTGLAPGNYRVTLVIDSSPFESGGQVFQPDQVTSERSFVVT